MGFGFAKNWQRPAKKVQRHLHTEIHHYLFSISCFCAFWSSPREEKLTDESSDDDTSISSLESESSCSTMKSEQSAKIPIYKDFDGDDVDSVEDDLPIIDTDSSVLLWNCDNDLTPQVGSSAIIGLGENWLLRIELIIRCFSLSYIMSMMFTSLNSTLWMVVSWQEVVLVGNWSYGIFETKSRLLKDNVGNSINKIWLPNSWWVNAGGFKSSWRCEGGNKLWKKGFSGKNGQISLSSDF